MVELVYVLMIFSAIFLVGYWIRDGDSRVEPWQVLSENATLRDRLVAHELSIPVLFTDGVPIDQLDLPMTDAVWMQLRHTVGFVPVRIRPTLKQRVAYWQSMSPYSGPLPPTVRQRIERIPRRWGRPSFVAKAPGDLDRRISEAEWYCFRAGFE